jgi:hypothetical protein
MRGSIGSTMSERRGSSALGNCGFLRNLIPVSAPIDPGEAALLRSTPCSMSSAEKDCPPMMYLMEEKKERRFRRDLGEPMATVPCTMRAL